MLATGRIVVIKHMTQVAAAVFANDFGAFHPQARIGDQLNSIALRDLGKTGPPCQTGRIRAAPCTVRA